MQITKIKMYSSRFFSSVIVVAAATFQAAAFTLAPTAVSTSHRSRTPPSLQLFEHDGLLSIHVTTSSTFSQRTDTSPRTRRQDPLDDELGGDDPKMWTLKLFNDPNNTRGYVCRCLVQIASLTEDESYRRMVQAHEHGEAVIGEYCQELAGRYMDALASNGLFCEMYPSEE